MLMAFLDNQKIVREESDIDFSCLQDTYQVYKYVIHNKYTAEEAGAQLDNIRSRKDQYRRWIRIVLYGAAAVCAGSFTFD